MAIIKKISSHIKLIAQAGLISKGIVYCLLGALAFMSAFHINGQSTQNTDKGGVFSVIYQQTGGKIMLAAIALGLICYTVWRVLQAVDDTEKKGSDTKGIIARGKYLFSALMYLAVSAVAIKMLFGGKKKSGDSMQSMAQELLTKPFGQWLVGIAALIFFAVGAYQIYYALSEKYRKYIDKSVNASNKKILLTAGKIGYISRGVVWLTISWLFIEATFNSNSSEAGDTSKAFDFLYGISYGPYILAAVGIGLICYGIFNFIRVRYENFNRKDKK